MCLPTLLFLGVEAREAAPPLGFRLSSDAMPAAPTKTQRVSFQPRRSPLTCSTVLASTASREDPRPDGQTIARHGRPTTICGTSDRLSLLDFRCRSASWRPPSGFLLSVIVISRRRPHPPLRGAAWSCRGRSSTSTFDGSEAEVDGLLELLLVLLEQVHRATPGALDADVLADPSSVSVQPVRWSARSGGHHREVRALYGGAPLAPAWARARSIRAGTTVARSRCRRRTASRRAPSHLSA